MREVVLPLSFVAFAIRHDHLTFTLSFSLIKVSLKNVLLRADHFAPSMRQAVLEGAFVVRATLSGHLSLTVSLIALKFALVYIAVG